MTGGRAGLLTRYGTGCLLGRRGILLLVLLLVRLLILLLRMLLLVLDGDGGRMVGARRKWLLIDVTTPLWRRREIPSLPLLFLLLTEHSLRPLMIRAATLMLRTSTLLCKLSMEHEWAALSSGLSMEFPAFTMGCPWRGIYNECFASCHTIS